jgi:putative exporter of polyketide antibiotics
VPDIAVASSDLSGLLMLVVVGVGLCLAGVAGASRRDLLTG